LANGVFTAQVVRLKVEMDLASFGKEDGFLYKEFLMLLISLGYWDEAAAQK
jgi:hypothetical protein